VSKSSQATTLVPRSSSLRACEENHILWFSSIASPVHARTRSHGTVTGVTVSCPAIGQPLLRCLNSGIGQPLPALPQLGHPCPRHAPRPGRPERLKKSQPLRACEENHILWFSSIASPVHARTRSHETVTCVTVSCSAIGQPLLRCLNSGIHAPRPGRPERLKKSQPLTAAP